MTVDRLHFCRTMSTLGRPISSNRDGQPRCRILTASKTPIGLLQKNRRDQQWKKAKLGGTSLGPANSAFIKGVKHFCKTNQLFCRCSTGSFLLDSIRDWCSRMHSSASQYRWHWPATTSLLVSIRLQFFFFTNPWLIKIENLKFNVCLRLSVGEVSMSTVVDGPTPASFTEDSVAW